MKFVRSLLVMLPPALAVGAAFVQQVSVASPVTSAPHWTRLAEGDAKTPDPTDPKAIEFFTTKVQPILATNCNGCHSVQRHRGGLSLMSRDAILKGGGRGPAVVPGDPDKSLLIKAVEYNDADLKMPPKHKLADEQIADLRHWVELGVPFVEAAPATPAAP